MNTTSLSTSRAQKRPFSRQQALKSMRLALQSVTRLMVPVAMLALTSCATIEALQLASTGTQLTEKGKYEEADAAFKSSLAKAETPAGHAGLGELYLKLGRFSEAEAELKKAIEKDTPLAAAQPQAIPQIVRYYLSLGKAQLLQNNGPAAFESANAVRSGIEPYVANMPMNKAILKEALLLQIRIIEATDDPHKALQIINDQGVQLRFPDDPDMKAERALIAALDGKTEEAGTLADAALKAKPTDGDAILARAVVLILKGEGSKTRDALTTVLTEDRTRAMVGVRVGRLLQKNGKATEAVELLKLLAEVQPNNYLIHMDMAALYYNLGQTDASIESYLKVLSTYLALKPYEDAKTPEALAAKIKELPPSEMDRTNLEIFYQNLALLYRSKKDFESGIKYLERCAAMNPQEGTFKDIAIYYREKGDMPGAIKSLERVLSMKPDDAQVLKTLGQLTIQTDAAKSRDYFARARKLSPNDPDILLGLGVGLYNAKMYKEAIAEFEDAVKLLPGNTDALFYLALSQTHGGDKKSAEANFLKLIEMKPDYADAYRELGNIARDRKDYKAVEKWYNLEDKYRNKKGK